MSSENRCVRITPIVFGSSRPKPMTCQGIRRRVSTYSSLLEEVFARVFPSSVARCAQVFHINKRRSGEHDGLEQDQADFSFASVSFVNHRQEIMQIQKRHVGMDKFDVCAKHFTAEISLWYGQSTLLLKIGDLVRSDFRRERFDESG